MHAVTRMQAITAVQRCQHSLNLKQFLRPNPPTVTTFQRPCTSVCTAPKKDTDSYISCRSRSLKLSSVQRERVREFTKTREFLTDRHPAAGSFPEINRKTLNHSGSEQGIDNGGKYGKPNLRLYLDIDNMPFIDHVVVAQSNDPDRCSNYCISALDQRRLSISVKKHDPGRKE